MINEYYESYYRNLEDNSNLRDLKERVKAKLHERLQRDKEFTKEDEEFLNPCNKLSITTALTFVKNPVTSCHLIYSLIQELNVIIPIIQEKSESEKMTTSTEVLYHSETWDLMARRWAKLEKDFLPKTKVFDISKIPDIYDCIKYDVEHNRNVLLTTEAWAVAVQLYTNVKYLADVVIMQEYGMTRAEKLTIAQGICTPLLKKIKADLQRNIEHTEEMEEDLEDSVNRLDGRYSTGVSSPGRHVRTRLYFTSESHIHSLLTVLSHGGLVHSEDEQWKRALEYVSLVSELNYMTQIVIMLYEDPTKDTSSEERFHVELHFSPGVNCCVQKELPPGPGFRPHSRNHEQSQKTSFDNGTQGSSMDSEDSDEAAPHPHPSGNDLLCSLSCSERQVRELFGRQESAAAAPPTRKRSSRLDGGSSPLPHLPSFQEMEETEDSKRHLSTSDPIPIKKVAMESSADIAVTGSDCQGKANVSRSFEDSRPRSLEMDMNMGPERGERESPMSKGEWSGVRHSSCDQCSLGT